MGVKFWVKSHKFRLLLRDLREWSLLIGSDHWSHDFAVRFSQKENDVVVSPCIVVSPHANGMLTPPIDRGDQELLKTFCGLKIGPLLRKLWAFKDW